MRSAVSLVAIASIALAGCAGPAASSPGASSLPTATAPAPSPSASPIAARPTGEIAFVRPAEPEGQGQVDIYLVAVAGGDPTRLTNDDRIEGDLMWLLDGSRLVYTWSTFEDPYHQTLAWVRPDGTDRRDIGPVQSVYSTPAVSPDGRTVVFSGDGTEDGSSGLVLLDLVAGTRRQLTTDGATGATWSPDGTRIAAYLPSRRVVIIDVATGAETGRIVDAGVDQVYGWTADGRGVIYKSCGPELNKPDCIAAPPRVADADGRNPRTYTGPLPEAIPELPGSPDGAWLLGIDASGALQVTPAAGGPPVVVGRGTNAAWAPDSAWIVFAAEPTDPGAIATGRSDGLVVVSRLGGPPIRLTDGPYDQGPAWRRG